MDTLTPSTNQQVLMSKPKFDPNKPFEVVESSGGKPKFDPNLPFESVDEPSLGETITGKLASGGILGFIDELAGGLEAGGQVIGLKGLGGKLKDIGLSDEGPTLDYDTLKNAYQSARNAERQQQAAMAKAHPTTSFLSELAGGAVSMPMGGGAATLGKLAVEGAKIGAIAGLGTSEADLTDGDIGGAIVDTGIGAGIGGIAAPVVSKALPIVGKGLKYVGGKAVDIIPGANDLIEAFKRARAGEKIASPKALKTKIEAMQGAIEKEVMPALKTVEGGKEAAAKTLQKDYQSTQKMIETHADDLVALEEKTQIATNAAEHKKLVQEVVDTAEDIQKLNSKQRHNVKKQYDYVENEADKAGLVVDTTPAMTTFYNTLKNDPKLKAEDMKEALKNVALGLKENASVKEYLEFYRKLRNITGDPTVLKAASAARKELRNSFNSTIDNSGRQDLSELLTDANSKWSALDTIETYIKNIVPEKDNMKDIVENATIATVKSFSEPGKELAVARSQNFRDILGKVLPNKEIAQLPQEFAAPETAASVIQKLEDLGQRVEANKAFKPSPIPKADILATNPEYQQLGDLLTKTKQKVPDIFPKIFGNKGQENVASFLETPGALEEMLQLFKASRTGVETSKVEAKIKLDQMFKAMQQENPTKAILLKSKLADMSKGIELSEKALKKTLLDNGSLLQKAIGTGEAGLIRLGEGLGAGTKAAIDLSGKALSKTGDTLVKTGETLAKLIGNDEFVAKLPEMANKFNSKGMEKYAAMLNKIHVSPPHMRKALIYTLVQEPEFRREMDKFNLEPAK